MLQPAVLAEPWRVAPGERVGGHVTEAHDPEAVRHVAFGQGEGEREGGVVPVADRGEVGPGEDRAAPRLLLEPGEYGFFGNVNPGKPHPRWSQATERVLPNMDRRPTRIYNGYGEWVGGLYSGDEY